MKRLRKGARITVLLGAGPAQFTVVRGSSRFGRIVYEPSAKHFWYPDVTLATEGILWCRGWEGPAVDALLAARALA